jgi:alpha-D-ribose 1-methylphosphonate 5-triphosphate diphosphatase PhnM
VGLGRTRGAIALGYDADVILVDPHGVVPRVVRTYVGGREIYAAPRSRRMSEAA